MGQKPILAEADDSTDEHYGHIAYFEDSEISITNPIGHDGYPKVWVDGIEVPQPVTAFIVHGVTAWRHSWDEDRWQTPDLDRTTVETAEIELIEGDDGEIVEATISLR